MATKKFINSINNVVDETLSGLCFTYPQLNYYPPKKVILSSEVCTRKIINHIINKLNNSHNKYIIFIK